MKKLIVLVVALLSLSLLTTAFAKDEPAKAKKKEPVVSSIVREIQGELVYAGPRSLSLVYSYDKAKGEESEILIPYDPKTIKLEHKRSLSELTTGDTVLVQYTEETSDYGDRKDITMKAITLRFLQPVDAQSRYKQKASVQEQAQEDEGLSLKGVKSDE
jgi:hypothetical protein